MIEGVLFVLSITTLSYEVFKIPLSVFVLAIILVSLSFMLLFPCKRGVIVGLCICFIALISGFNMARVQKEIPRTFYGERTMEGYIISVNQKLEEKIVVFHDEAYEKNIQFKVSYSDLLPQDKVTIQGIVTKPIDFITDTGRVFPYKTFLQSKKIYGVMDTVSIVKVQKGSFHPMRLATTIRHSIARIYAQHVTFPVDGIISGMLVGYQGGLSNKITDLFRDTGVLHVLVLSGSNITLFAGMLALICKPLPERARFVIISFLIILLVLVSGSGVAATRAGIMGVIALLIPLFNKKYNARKILFLVYGFFLLVSPYTVLYDPGFHLSFIATFSMIVVIPKLEKSITWIPNTRYVNIKEILLLALALPIIMLPYTMYFSGVVPLSGIFANILFALILPILLFLGVVTILFSPLPPIASMFGIILSFLGSIIIAMLHICDSIPKLNTPALSWWGVGIIYGSLAIIFFRKDFKLHVQQLQNLLRQPSNLID